MSQTYILRRDGCDYQAPDLQTMRTWAQDGRVLPTDMVYSPRYQSWYRARDLRELRDVLPRVESRPPAAARPVAARPAAPVQTPQPAPTAPAQPQAQPQQQRGATQQFWLRKGDKNYAADSLQTILRWASEGNISPDDYIYHPSYNKWFRAGDSPQLASRFPRSVSQASAAQTSAAATPEPSPSSSVERADSVQRTVMDFRAAELHRMIQARKAEINEDRGRLPRSKPTSGSATRRGLAIRPDDARSARDAQARDEAAKSGRAARPKTGRLPTELSQAGVKDDRADSTSGRRARITSGQARLDAAAAKAKARAARPLSKPLPTLPKPKSKSTEGERPVKPQSTPKPAATPKPKSRPAELSKPEPTPKPEAGKRVGPPALPESVRTPEPAEAKAQAKPAEAKAKPVEASAKPPEPPTPAPIDPKPEPEQAAPPSDPPEPAPVEDAGTGIDQGMAVPPDAGAAIAVRYEDRLNLMRPLYDVARVFVVTRDLRPGELQETECRLPRSNDDFKGLDKRSIYQTLTKRMREHLEGKVAEAKPLLESRELDGYALFLERAEFLVSVMAEADAVIGEKPPERFVIGNAGRAKMSPGEESAMLRIDAAFKGLISIKAKG